MTYEQSPRVAPKQHSVPLARWDVGPSHHRSLCQLDKSSASAVQSLLRSRRCEDRLPGPTRLGFREQLCESSVLNHSSNSRYSPLVQSVCSLNSLLAPSALPPQPLAPSTLRTASHSSSCYTSVSLVTRSFPLLLNTSLLTFIPCKGFKPTESGPENCACCTFRVL